jgi:cobyrinic acid a,c-diamide synthase
VIEHYTDVTVLGAVAHHGDMEILERHLGLIPSNEQGDADRHIAHIGDSIARQVDLDQLISLAATAATPPACASSPFSIAHVGDGLRIGIARDEAFGFYYPGDLEAMQEAGAELVPINTLRDAELPDIDGLFIGGGFPESCMQQLQANRQLRQQIKNAIEAGLPTYAECGGLMYLARSLSWHDKTCDMVGVIAGDVVMHERPQGRGYVRLMETAALPWPAAEQKHEIAAHEFHYSALENLHSPDAFAFDILRGTGIDGHYDGYVYKNLLACYTHQRNTRNNRWTERFLRFVTDCRAQQTLLARNNH